MNIEEELIRYREGSVFRSGYKKCGVLKSPTGDYGEPVFASSPLLKRIAKIIGLLSPDDALNRLYGYQERILKSDHMSLCFKEHSFFGAPRCILSIDRIVLLVQISRAIGAILNKKNEFQKITYRDWFSLYCYRRSLCVGAIKQSLGVAVQSTLDTASGTDQEIEIIDRAIRESNPQHHFGKINVLNAGIGGWK